MNNYQDMIRNIADKILNGGLKYRDTILIGDNSIGKSDLLRELLKKNEDGEMYYLDTVNRRFLVEKVEFNRKKKDIAFNRSIVETRLDEQYFNLQDSFNIYGTHTEGIETLYPYYEKKVKQLFKEFLNIDFTVEQDIEKYSIINGQKRRLSNGYQALIRIFFELQYYYDTVVKEADKERYLFIIDEINECLTPNNACRLLTFIKEHYSKIDLIVTTQLADVIAGTRDFNIIAMLPNEKYEILDTNDFDNVIDANNLFIKSFPNNTRNSQKQEVDRELSRLFNNRISGELDSSDKEALERIKQDNLSKAQLVLLRQIEEW